MSGLGGQKTQRPPSLHARHRLLWGEPEHWRALQTDQSEAPRIPARVKGHRSPKLVSINVMYLRGRGGCPSVALGRSRLSLTRVPAPAPCPPHWRLAGSPFEPDRAHWLAGSCSCGISTVLRFTRSRLFRVSWSHGQCAAALSRQAGVRWAEPCVLHALAQETAALRVCTFPPFF